MTRCNAVPIVISLGLWLTPSAQDISAIALPTAETSANVTEPALAPVQAVAGHLEGIMSTSVQAAEDPNFVGVQMTTCQVTVADSQPNAIYLYQEQALVENLDAPYRQRFLQITSGENHRVNSITYKPENPSDWTGLCGQPTPTVALSELGEVACTVSLRTSYIGGFVGSTPAGGCPASVRGAASITNVVVLHEAGMDTWDRGFDAAGNQVWGAQDVPYRYRR